MAGNLPPEAETDAMRRGSFHESAVLREFFFRHPEISVLDGAGRTVRISDWLAVTPDGTGLREPGCKVLVEAKTTENWDHWGQAGTDEIPEYYRAQVIPCAELLGCDEIRVAVIGPFWDFREYVVKPNPPLARAILARCHEFWLSVQSGHEPALSATVASYETWSKVRDGDPAGSVEIPPDLAVRYLTAVAGENDVKPSKALIANHLDTIGAKAAVCQGQTIAVREHAGRGTVKIRVGYGHPDITRIDLEVPHA